MSSVFTAEIPTKFGCSADPSYLPYMRLGVIAFKSQFGGPGTLTQQNANDQAVDYECFYARSGTNNNYPSLLSGMRALREGATPPQLDLRMLWYDDDGGIYGPAPSLADASHVPNFYMYSTPQPPATGTLQDADSYQTGTVLTGNHVMRLMQRDVQKYMGAHYLASIPAGYDGGGPDVMGLYPAIPTPGNNNALRTPWHFDRISNATPYTGKEWLVFAAATMDEIRASIGVITAGKNLRLATIANGIDDGDSYFDAVNPTSYLMPHADVWMVEQFIRGQNQAIGTFPTETQLQHNVDMMIDASITYKVSLMCGTSIWPNASATIAQIKQWFQIAMAIYYLGLYDGVRHFFCFRADNPADSYVAGTTGDGSGNAYKGRHHQYTDDYFSSSDKWYSRLNLGAPTDTFGTALGYKVVTNSPSAGRYLYVRRFSRGLVLVNPTANTCTYTPALTGGPTWQGVDGTTYTQTGAIAVASNTAVIVSTI